MNRLVCALWFDIALQARHGFYAATAVMVVIVGALLLAVPAALRENAGLWVPALIAVNLPITTLFFIAGLILLERDEGTLAALGTSPADPGEYLALRMLTLIALAVVETLAVTVLAFDLGSLTWLLLGATLMGVFYTACGAGLSARYSGINELILPASVLVTFLLVPLLPHLGLAPRAPFLIHPLEPAMTLMRGAYTPLASADAAYGIAGSLAWCGAAWVWGRSSIARAMRNTAATGGR